MNTITEARIGASAKGLTIRRSITTPPMNEAITVAKKANQ